MDFSPDFLESMLPSGLGEDEEGENPLASMLPSGLGEDDENSVDDENFLLDLPTDVDEEIRKNLTLEDVLKDSMNGVPMSDKRRRELFDKNYIREEPRKKKRKRSGDEEDDEREEEEDDEDDDENEIAPPQVKMTEDGFVVNETNVIIRDPDYESYETVEEQRERFTNYSTYSRKKKIKKWTNEDEDKLFTGIRMFGMELGMISTLFLYRNRPEIKRKLKKLEKTQPSKLKWCMKKKIKIDFHWLKKCHEEKERIEGVEYDSSESEGENNQDQEGNNNNEGNNNENNTQNNADIDLSQPQEMTHEEIINDNIESSFLDLFDE